MDTPAPYTTPPPARATAQSNAVLYPAGPWTEAQQSRLEHTVLEGFAMKKRALAAEARVQELLGELAGLATQVQEVRLTALRLKVEISEQEVAKLDLILEGVTQRAELTRLKESIRAELKEAYGQGEWANIHFMIEALKPEPTGNAAAYEIIRQQMARQCAKCAGKVNAYEQCFTCDMPAAQ